MIDLHEHLESLSERRPVFHSESDFQLALGLDIARTLPELDLRLERPVEEVEGRPTVDIWFRAGPGEVTVVELKYLTAKAELEADGETYRLAQRGQQGLRYAYLNDLNRVERIVEAGKADRGAAILLANEDRYWRELNTDSADQDFRLHEGRKLEGELRWDPLPTWVEKKREPPIQLRGSYTVHWRHFSKLEGANSEFRYLLLTTG